jgi:hypothetical protein
MQQAIFSTLMMGQTGSPETLVLSFNQTPGNHPKPDHFNIKRIHNLLFSCVDLNILNLTQRDDDIKKRNLPLTSHYCRG